MARDAQWRRSAVAGGKPLSGPPVSLAHDGVGPARQRLQLSVVLANADDQLTEYLHAVWAANGGRVQDRIEVV